MFWGTNIVYFAEVVDKRLWLFASSMECNQTLDSIFIDIYNVIVTVSLEHPIIG